MRNSARQCRGSCCMRRSAGANCRSRSTGSMPEALAGTRLLQESNNARLHLPSLCTGKTMGLISLLWGMFAMLWMLLALVPLLGWGNWFLIPFAAIGALIAAIAIALTSREKRGRAKAGLVLNGIVIIVAVVRLNLGGGII